MKNTKIVKKILFLLINFHIFADKYIPKNQFESDYLNNLKKEQISIGLVKNHDFLGESKNGDSINSLIKEMFLEYLDLNVIFIEKEYSELQELLEVQKIQGIALINREKLVREKLNLTNPIFSRDIYIASSNKILSGIKTLNNKKIYYEKDNFYLKFFDHQMQIYNIDVEMIEVDSINNYKNQLILTTVPEYYNLTNYLSITRSAGYTLGMIDSYSKLVNILDSSLNQKYRKKINILEEKIRKEYSKNNFLNSLTNSEKMYLKKLKTLNTSYDNDVGIMSYWSNYKKEYKGVVPLLIKGISEALNIEIKTHKFEKKDRINALKNGNLDFIILSKTGEKSNKFIFSNKISEIATYVVNLRDNISQQRRVGVLKYNIGEEMVNFYDIPENINIYPNYRILREALDSRKIEYILTTDISNFNFETYKIRIFQNVPINLGLNKNNILLKEIIDKALLYLVDIEILKKQSLLEQEEEELFKRKVLFEEKKTLIILLLILLAFIFYILSKIKKERKITSKLSKDELTGLLGREKFNSFCFKNIEKNGFGFVIDLNNFKNINDTKGHEFGDEIIIEFANFFKNICKYEYIFRISGDEFYGFLESELEETISKFKKYKEHCPLMIENNVSFSLGLCKIKTGESLKDKFRYADLIMLQNKKKYEFSYGVVNSEFILSKEKEEKIIQELKSNLENFYAVYQPKFSITDNKIIGAEALARYYSSKFGNIYPDEFIGIAEKHKMIHKVDYIIAEKSIAYLKAKITEGKLPKDFKISFNLSVQTFEREDVVQVLKGLLQKYKITEKNFEIEITESLFIVKANYLVKKLEELKKIGFSISLDDFTAGHSTPSLLSILPIDTIKFDKSLLDPIEENCKDKKSMKVYHTLTCLIRELEMEIISEGVETLDQLRYVHSLGIEYIQGYFISKPVGEDELDFVVSNHGGKDGNVRKG
ncbi:MAG: EAL domain-containing protein [Fusobacteriaceae bacterium]